MNNFVEKRIRNVKEGDFKVAVSGIVVSKGQNSFMIDDGTGQAGVFYGGEIEQGKYFRVFGRVSRFGEGLEIEAEFIQSLEGIDKQLHQQIVDIMNK